MICIIFVISISPNVVAYFCKTCWIFYVKLLLLCKTILVQPEFLLTSQCEDAFAVYLCLNPVADLIPVSSLSLQCTQRKGCWWGGGGGTALDNTDFRNHRLNIKDDKISVRLSSHNSKLYCVFYYISVTLSFFSAYSKALWRHDPMKAMSGSPHHLTKPLPRR